MKGELTSILTSFIAVLIGVAIAFAGSWGNNVIYVGKIPLFALCVIIAFAVQWLAFIPAYIFRTEKFYDITGSITYSSIIILVFIINGNYTPRTILLTVLILTWTFRLGFFLFKRVLKAGEDRRFADIKQSFTQFLRAWTLQGLWISLTLAAALAALTVNEPLTYSIYDWVLLILGGITWLIGFSFEAIADYQKSKFRAKPENKGKFISTGLWSISRHPNYFGEIVIWIGIALISLPTLSGWRFFTLISPIFVALLITKISGIPLLEAYADKKWGGQEDYEEYKRNTPVLIPFRFKKR